MKKFIRKCPKVLNVLLIIFMIFPTFVKAASTSFSFSGNTSVNTNSDFSVEVAVVSDEGLSAIEGYVKSLDSSCAKVTSIESLEPDSVFAEGSMFLYYSMAGNGLNGTKKLFKVNLKAGSSACTTKLSVYDVTASFRDTNKPESHPTGSVNITVGGQKPVNPTESNDATLKSLTPSTGKLSPAFASNTLSYTMKVSESTTKVDFSGATNNSKASIASGQSCNLSGNTTACKIVVKAEDGTTKTYTVNVTKESGGTNAQDPTPDTPKSNDATLKKLDVSGFTLSPRFNKNTTSYSMTVNNNITGLKVTAIPNNNAAKVTVTGNNNWQEGMNTVRITVKAEDGSEKTYIVNVNRKSSNNNDPTSNTKSSDNYLKSLTIKNGVLLPTFNKDISNYSLEVGNEITKLDVSAITNNKNAKVTITGADNLQVGANAVNIEVTAEDGSIRVYTINVTRSEQASNNKLSGITIKDYPLNPGFNKDIFEYNVNVDSDVDELDISAIASNKNAKVEITGNKNLKEGNNVVLIKVTDENGISQYYRLNVNKDAAHNKALGGLSSSQWLLLGGLLLLTLLFLLILFLLLRRKKDKEEPQPVKQDTPVNIEFKPEFNFGSKNGTDDDYVESGGVINQYVGTPKQVVEPEEPKYIEAEEASFKEIPYDPYDDVVTKDELVDAIDEAIETKDPAKLKMLLEQEKLNRRKEELRREEENKEE